MVTTGEVKKAKEKAVGGKKDRCRKGKSCSATCISGWKVCLVEVSDVISTSLKKAKESIAKKAEQVVPGKRKKYIEGRKEKYERVIGKVVARAQRAGLRGDIGKKAETIRKIDKLEGTIGRKLKIPRVSSEKLSDERTDARREKYKEVKNSLIKEMTKFAREDKKGSYDKLEKALLNLQTKAGGKFGDKEPIGKGDIWGKTKDVRNPVRQVRFVSVHKKLTEDLERAARDGDKKEYNKVEKALLRMQKSKTGKDLITPITQGATWSKLKPTSPDRESRIMLRDYLKEQRDLKSEKVPKLSKLFTLEDFEKKLSDTKGLYNEVVKKAAGWIKKISVGFDDQSYYRPSGSPAEIKFFKALGRSLGKGMGGKQNAISAVDEINNFTMRGYTGIRNAQMGRGGTEDNLKKGALIDKFINRGEVIKPRLEKFRGKNVEGEELQRMIAEAKSGASFPGRALASWSTELKTARDYSDQKTGRPERVIYRAINTKGAPISSISNFTNEQEILTPSNANYRYLGYRAVQGVNADGKPQIYHIFDVEET